MGLIVRKKARKLITLSAALIFAANAFGQASTGNDQMATAPVYTFYPYIPELGGELIYPLSNYALRDNFGGVYSVHASFQGKLINRLYAGVELQDNQISVATPVTFRVAIATTNIFFNDAGAKLAYYSSETNTWQFSCSVVVGESWLSFTKMPDSLKAPPGGFGKQAVFFSGRVFEGYKVNDELRIGLEVTYTMYNYTFDPAYVGIATEYTNAQKSGTTSFIGWGFALHYLLGKPQH
jgi:hypothetical protein